MGPDEGALRLTETILEIAKEAIGQREMNEIKSNHPWMTDEIVNLKREKLEAEGAEHETLAREKYAAAILRTREAYIERTRAEIGEMKRGSKKFWATSGAMLGKPAKACAVPALRAENGEWTLHAQSKAELLAKTSAGKHFLPDASPNEFSILPGANTPQELIFPFEEQTLKNY